jgi:hypothetical protein
VKFLYYSHPPIGERLEMAEEKTKEMNEALKRRSEITKKELL